MYNTITKNLLMRFHQTDPAIQPLTINLESFPDFRKLPFSPHLSQAQKDKNVHDSIITFTANLATDATKCSNRKVSFWDIEMQHAKDVKLTDDQIKDNVDSFLQGLFQFRCAHAQLHGWTSTTYLVTHKAANSDVDSNDDSCENDANKWSATNINLFKDFEKFNLPQMKVWAEDFWTDMDAELAAADGQSTIYTHKAFTKFIFGSIAPSLQKSIQNLITDP